MRLFFLLHESSYKDVAYVYEIYEDVAYVYESEMCARHVKVS